VSKAPATRANTGAATAPPVWTPRGSSMPTAIATRGASSGASPMNHAMYLSFA
jgi:hypothetical protein